MTNNKLCLTPAMKLPLFELFVELLVRKNRRVTRKPLCVHQNITMNNESFRDIDIVSPTLCELFV